MNWHSANLQEKADILRQVHALEPHQRFTFETAAVETQAIPFYRGGLLIRCREQAWREGEKYLWYVKLPEQEIVALDGSVANIHHLNFNAGLRLTENLVPAYLKFRLYFETPRRYLAGKVATETAGENFVCTASVLEAGEPYAARFRLDARGVMETVSRQPLSSGKAPPPAEFRF